jgi:hypothetical protein
MGFMASGAAALSMISGIPREQPVAAISSMGNTESFGFSSDSPK